MALVPLLMQEPFQITWKLYVVDFKGKLLNLVRNPNIGWDTLSHRSPGLGQPVAAVAQLIDNYCHSVRNSITVIYDRVLCRP